MRLALFAAVAMLAACSRPAAEAPSAETPSIEAATADAASTVEPYAPMAAFAPFSGKTFRGEWTDENGERLVDFAKWELILNGRALQSTHRLEGKDYGGRTIFFMMRARRTTYSTISRRRGFIRRELPTSSMTVLSPRKRLKVTTASVPSAQK